MGVEITVEVSNSFDPYVPIPDSAYRVKLSFWLNFENGGSLSGEGFLLDIDSSDISHWRAAELLVSSMNLARTKKVTLIDLEVVRRGEHDDAWRA